MMNTSSFRIDGVNCWDYLRNRGYEIHHLLDGETITRYESHQVQDRAHDMILKKIDQDPEWFLELLEESKEKIQPSSYDNYKKKAVSFALSSSKERILKIKAFVASVSV